jgi:hypothetical protein
MSKPLCRTPHSCVQGTRRAKTGQVGQHPLNDDLNGESTKHQPLTAHSPPVPRSEKSAKFWGGSPGRSFFEAPCRRRSPRYSGLNLRRCPRERLAVLTNRLQCVGCAASPRKTSAAEQYGSPTTTKVAVLPGVRRARVRRLSVASRGHHPARPRSNASASSTLGSMRAWTVIPCRCSWSNRSSSVAASELALGTVGAVDGDSHALTLLFDRSSQEGAPSERLPCSLGLSAALFM